MLHWQKLEIPCGEKRIPLLSEHHLLQKRNFTGKGKKPPCISMQVIAGAFNFRLQTMLAFSTVIPDLLVQETWLFINDNMLCGSWMAVNCDGEENGHEL